MELNQTFCIKSIQWLLAGAGMVHAILIFRTIIHQFWCRANIAILHLNQSYAVKLIMMLTPKLVWKQLEYYVSPTNDRHPCYLVMKYVVYTLNTLRPRQDGCYFADDVSKCIFFNENVWVLLKIPLNFVPKGPINNIPALVQIMAWCRPGNKPLSEPMLVYVPTHICVTRPQWFNDKLRLNRIVDCYFTIIISSINWN